METKTEPVVTEKKRGPKAKIKAIKAEAILPALTAYVPRDVSFINSTTTLFDWKSLIPSKYIEINSAWLREQGIEPKDIETEEQREEIKLRAGEENLIIKLAGFKHLAHLRGIHSVDYEIHHVSEKHVSSLCLIRFSEASVTDKDGTVRYFPSSTITGVANATELNTSYPFSMFLESMAENRSFIRAVKTAFNINILGAEELHTQPSKGTGILVDDEGCTSPQESLRMAVEGKGKGFPDLLESLKKKGSKECEGWTSFEDVPPTQCFEIIASILAKK